MNTCIPENYALINPVEQSLLGLMILVIMFGMGSGLTLSNFTYVLKKPKGVVIGFLSQFGWMPLLAYVLATLLQLEPLFAIALILVGAIPAGTTSNMFAYFSRGDVALSITMTVCSTIAAVVMTPLMMKIYASGFAAQVTLAGGGEFKIPYASIIQSLVLVLVPVAAGMLLRRFSPGWAKAAEDTAGFMGIIVILFLIGMFLIDPVKRCMMAATPGNVYLGAVGIGVAGFALGYLASTIVRLKPRERRTVSLETGIQNGPLAFAIVLLSFARTPEIEGSMLWLPILYSFFIVISSSFTTMFFRKIGKLDHEIFENQEVQRRLFGKAWTPLKD
ncbi:MAG: bile acid:sodium symporter [Spirochaetales bacterium]|nr:bile acid:sodium symporter [Spirochaetales bacterium]